MVVFFLGNSESSRFQRLESILTLIWVLVFSYIVSQTSLMLCLIFSQSSSVGSLIDPQSYQTSNLNGHYSPVFFLTHHQSYWPSLLSVLSLYQSSLTFSHHLSSVSLTLRLYLSVFICSQSQWLSVFIDLQSSSVLSLILPQSYHHSLVFICGTSHV